MSTRPCKPFAGTTNSSTLAFAATNTTALNVPFTPWHPNLLIVRVGFWGMGLRFEPRFLSSAHARVPGQRSLQGPFFKLLEQNGKAVGQLTLHRRILILQSLSNT
jgi:hypothetical protein